MKSKEQVLALAREAIERREKLLEDLARSLRMAKEDPIWWAEIEELHRTLAVCDAQLETLLEVLEVGEAEMLASLLSSKQEQSEEKENREDVERRRR